MKKKTEGVQQSPVTAPLNETNMMNPTGVRIASWRDWNHIAQKEHDQKMQQLVDGIFREQIMGVLALLLVPILLLLDYAQLPGTIAAFLAIIDIAIWIFFVLEYICRLIVAHDRYAYVIAPWHIVDVLIVGIPAIALLSGTGIGIARYLRVLRAMQSVQVLYIAAKRAHRHFTAKRALTDIPGPTDPMRVRSLPFTHPGINDDQPVPSSAWTVIIVDESTNLEFVDHWSDLSGYTNADLPALSRLTRIPQYQLEVKLRERAYPRADVTGPVTTIFLKIPKIREEQSDPPVWEITWEGLLIAFNKDFVLTFSRSSADITDRVLSDGTAQGIVLNGPGILYLAVSISLSTIEDLILAAEEQLVYLETQSMNQLPQNFLAMMYSDQKELSRIISGLLHTKTALEEICTSDRAVFCRGDTEEGRIRTLVDRCSLLSDTAQHVTDSFAWMVDFYLNTASFSMNRVMKLLAVLTALTMIPALVGGLLGMNLIGNPWPATLLQMVSVVALVMLMTAWVYYNIGWLKE